MHQEEGQAHEAVADALREVEEDGSDDSDVVDDCHKGLP